MARKIKIRKKDKFLGQEAFFILLDDFIQDSYRGRRTKKNGSRISEGTIRNYTYLRKALIGFAEQSSFELKLYISDHLTQQEKEKAQRYWRKFYNDFTSFMYNKLDYYDNYVGLIVKCFRSFFNYLIIDRNIEVGPYHKSFYVPVEEIQIIALNHEQLNYIIYDEQFNTLIAEQDLEKVRDIFVFGCTVALRVSDLLSLARKNIEIQGDAYYIKVKSQKTGSYTSIKLPDYCIDIVNKYSRYRSRVLPPISAAWFNTRLKEMALLIPDNFEIVKTRERQGKQKVIYRDPIKRQHYRLSDHLSTHTMRRTAITTMLNLGMPEHLVRKISGHAPNSREFFRYVKLSQSFIDNETDQIFDKIKSVKNTNGKV